MYVNISKTSKTTKVNKMKQGQKLQHLRNNDSYKVMNCLKHDRFLIESNKDAVIVHKDDIKLNFKVVK